MRPVQSLLLAVALWTGLAAAPAWAGRSQDGGGSWCQQNPDKCANLKSRRDDYCKKNPQSCESGDQRQDSRKRGGCNDNPHKCEPRRRGDN